MTKYPPFETFVVGVFCQPAGMGWETCHALNFVDNATEIHFVAL